jgi:hypothetical protein
MKLFKFNRTDDYGVCFNLGILEIRRRSFLQISVGYSKTPVYFLQIQISQNPFLSFLLCFWKFDLSIDFIGHSWTK